MRAVTFVSVEDAAKALRPFLGKPLVLWSVEAALASGAFERVVVLSGDPEVRAAVSAPNVETVGFEIEREDVSRAGYDAVVHLPTLSPLVGPHEIRDALARFVASGADSLASVVRLRGTLWTEAGPQDDAERFVENGAIVISNARDVVERGRRIFGRTELYEMPAAPDDWRSLEALVGVRRKDDAVRERGAILRGVKLILSDVDGVLTDAGMVYGEGGDELKRFNTRDGKGFEIVRNLGIKTGIVTSENTALVARRADKLRLDVLHQGIHRKDVSLGEICAELGIAPSEVAYIGDDVNDLPILARVGFAACPADAVDEVKGVAHYVCRAKGGEGAVRELCDLVVRAYETPVP